MAKQTIGLGTAPTGVGGDTPRTAFTKTQQNFDEVYAALGANTAAASVYGKSNSVGTVSQSSGVPTGALMEGGVNASGNYEKYACGTLICRETRTINIAVSPGGFVAPVLAFPVTPVGQYFTITELNFYTGFDGTADNLYASRQTYGRPGLFINTGFNSSASVPSFTALGSNTAQSYIFRTLIIGRWF